MPSSKLDQAFTNWFINGNFGLPIAHENLPYEPVANVPYAEITLLQNDSTPWSLASSDQTDGVFRVILRYPGNTGATAAKAKAEDIHVAFRTGTRICYNGVCATTLSHSRQAGGVEGGWYKLLIDIRYRAFLTRQ